MSRKIDEQALYEMVALEKNRPTQIRIAELLGISLRTLQNYLRDWRKEGRHFPPFFQGRPKKV